MSVYGRARVFPGRTPNQRDRERTEALRLLTENRRVVYALQLPDGLIKIGCTINLINRRNSVRPGPSEVLAFIYGEHMDEQALHQRLKAHRARGREFYHPTPEVLEVVNEMRDQFDLAPLGKSLNSAEVKAEPERAHVRST